MRPAIAHDQFEPVVEQYGVQHGRVVGDAIEWHRRGFEQADALVLKVVAQRCFAQSIDGLARLQQRVPVAAAQPRGR